MHVYCRNKTRGREEKQPELWHFRLISSLLVVLLSTCAHLSSCISHKNTLDIIFIKLFPFVKIAWTSFYVTEDFCLIFCLYKRFPFGFFKITLLFNNDELFSQVSPLSYFWVKICKSQGQEGEYRVQRSSACKGFLIIAIELLDQICLHPHRCFTVAGKVPF